VLGARVVEKMLSQGKSVDSIYESMLPEPVKITVLFADLRSFTPYAEKNSAQAVSEYLADFYQEASELVYTSGGIVNKIMGDGLMMIYGAPFSLEDQEKAAVSTGLTMLREWNKTAAKKGAPGLGAGVATGECIVGNISFKKQINYTALGDTVNTAARLSGAPLGTLWAASTTVEACKEDFPWEKTEPMKLKGKSDPLDIFQLKA